MPGAAQVLAICVVHEIRPDPFGQVSTTAIDKRSIRGPVRLSALGAEGDTQCDTANHGGLDQAVYAYAEEDAAWWAAELGREAIPAGLFGENLRTAGIDVSAAEIGERWRIGTAAAAGVLVEVTAPRIPCATFQRRMAEEHWVRRFTERGAPGAYLRVLEEGVVDVGDPITVLSRPGHGITIADAFLRSDPARMRRLLAAADAGAFQLGA